MKDIRIDLTLLSVAMERYEEVITKVADTRWKFEMLRMFPEIGIRQIEDRVETITSDQFRRELEHLEDELDRRADVVMELTNSESVEEAREKYSRLAHAYNEREEIRKEVIEAKVRGNGVGAGDFEGQLATADAYLAEIRAKLEIGPPSRIITGSANVVVNVG